MNLSRFTQAKPTFEDDIADLSTSDDWMGLKAPEDKARVGDVGDCPQGQVVAAFRYLAEEESRMAARRVLLDLGQSFFCSTLSTNALRVT